MSRLVFIVLSLSCVASIDTVGTAGCSAPICVFSNPYLRFGTGSENSVNSQGLFVQPWYYSQTSNTWYKLTYNNYPLDTAIGMGYGSSHWSGATITDLYSLTSSNSVTDYSGFIVNSSDTTKSVGYGVIVANRTFTISGNPVILQNTFSLGATDSFVKIITRLINIGDLPIKNAIMWTGTRDDYVGMTDVNIKIRGNLNTGSFVPVTYNNQSSRAIMIKNTNEGVLFYSETPGVMTSYALCCVFSNAYNTYPLSLAPQTPSPTDGSYAAVLPIGNVSSGNSGSITWYYAAGTVSSLATVAQSVATAQALDSGIVLIASDSSTPTLTQTTSTSITPTGTISQTTSGTVSQTPSATTNSAIKIFIGQTTNISLTETIIVQSTYSEQLLYIVGFVPVLSILTCVCCMGVCICGAYLRYRKNQEVTEVTKVEDKVNLDFPKSKWTDE